MVNMYEWKILKEVQPHGIPGWEKPKQGAFLSNWQEGAFAPQMAFPPDFRFTGVQTPMAEGAMHSMDLDDGKSGSIGAFEQWKQNRRMREAFKQQQKHIGGLAASGDPLPPGFAGPGVRGKKAKDLVREKGSPYVLYTDRGAKPIGPGGSRGPKTHRIADFSEKFLSRAMPYLHGPSIRQRQRKVLEDKSDVDALQTWMRRSDYGRKTYIPPREDINRLANIFARQNYDRKDIMGILQHGPAYLDILATKGRKHAANMAALTGDASLEGGVTSDTVGEGGGEANTVNVKDLEAKLEEGDYESLDDSDWGLIRAKADAGELKSVENNPAIRELLQELENYEEGKAKEDNSSFDHESEYGVCPQCNHEKHAPEWCNKCDPDTMKRIHQQTLDDQNKDNSSVESMSQFVKPEDMAFYGILNTSNEKGKSAFDNLLDMAKPFWKDSNKIQPDYRSGEGDPIQWLQQHTVMREGNWDLKAKNNLNLIIDQYENPNSNSERVFPRGHPQVGQKMGAEGLKAEAKAWLSLWMQLLAGPNPEGTTHWSKFEQGLDIDDMGGKEEEGKPGKANPKDSKFFISSLDDPIESAWSILKIGA